MRTRDAACWLASIFPFDLSRLALPISAKARKRFAGGFSLGLWSYVRQEWQDTSRPKSTGIAIKHIDSKRALKGFTDRKEARR